jgi:hypothetical protein
VRTHEEQVRTHEEQLVEYEEMQKKYAPIPDLSTRLIPLGLGIAPERAALSFWRDLAGEQPSD